MAGLPKDGNLKDNLARMPAKAYHRTKINIPEASVVNLESRAGSISELSWMSGTIARTKTKKRKAICCCFFWVEDTYAWFELFAFFIKTEISFPGMVNKPPGINKSKIVKIDE